MRSASVAILIVRSSVSGMASDAVWEPHLKLSWGGNLGVPAMEVWSNTVKWKVTGFEPSRDELESACAAVAPIIGTWLHSADAAINQSAVLSWVKLNWVLATGKQRDAVTVLHELLPSVAGGNSYATPPFYQTAAITLRTRLTRGRAHSGRIFPPMVAFDTASLLTPYASVASVNAQANAFITLLRNVRTALGTAFTAGHPGALTPDPGVFSAGSIEHATAPLWEPIISAVVDRVPDVQHRRTNRIPRSEGTTVVLDPA